VLTEDREQLAVGRVYIAYCHRYLERLLVRLSRKLCLKAGVAPCIPQRVMWQGHEQQNLNVTATN